MKFVTEMPKSNFEKLMNFAHGKDDEVYIYDEEGNEIRLTEYVSKHCEMKYGNTMYQLFTNRSLQITAGVQQE